MAYKKTYNPCVDCLHSYSTNNQENNMCKICKFKELLAKPTADVVPKSEYEEAVKVIEKIKCIADEIKAELPHHNEMIKTETASEIFKELDEALAYCLESHPYAIERYSEIKRKYKGENTCS